jgi:hypothetical protein
MFRVRTLRGGIRYAIEESRKLRSEPEGEYYVADIRPDLSVNPNAVGYLQQLGVLGEARTVLRGEYCGRISNRWIAVYPVNFDRADYCMERLERFTEEERRTVSLDEF